MLKSTNDRSAVAQCCLNSAAMLMVADQGEVNKTNRASILNANKGQARLLVKAADIADEMLAALQEISRNAALDDAWLAPVHAAIRKATGAA